MKCTLFVSWLACMGAIQAQSLPSGESLLDRHVEVTGGIGAYETVQSLIVRFSYTDSKLRPRGNQVLYLAEGDSIYLFF